MRTRGSAFWENTSLEASRARMILAVVIGCAVSINGLSYAQLEARDDATTDPVTDFVRHVHSNNFDKIIRISTVLSGCETVLLSYSHLWFGKNSGRLWFGYLKIGNMFQRVEHTRQGGDITFDEGMACVTCVDNTATTCGLMTVKGGGEEGSAWVIQRNGTLLDSVKIVDDLTTGLGLFIVEKLDSCSATTSIVELLDVPSH